MYVMKLEPVSDWIQQPVAMPNRPNEIGDSLTLEIQGQIVPPRTYTDEDDLFVYAVRNHIELNLPTVDIVVGGPGSTRPIGAGQFVIQQTGGRRRQAKLGDTWPEYEFPRARLMTFGARDGRKLAETMATMDAVKRLVSRTWTREIPSLL